MAKYLVIQDCTAEGTNITPYGSEIPNFLLTYPFHQGQTIEGVAEEEFVSVNTTEGTRADGSIYNGDCVFYIPLECVKDITGEEEPLPPIPAPENAPPSSPDAAPLPAHAESAEQPSIPSQDADVQPLIPVDEYIQLKKTKKKNEEFIILGVFLALLLAVILSKC